MPPIVLRIFGLLGVLMFAPLFILSFTDPLAIERSAASFVKERVEQDLHERIDALDSLPGDGLKGALGRKVAEKLADAEQRLQQLRAQLKAKVPAILAEQIARMQDLDCECRRKWEAHIGEAMQWEIQSLETSRERLIDFTQQRYLHIVTELRNDVRIMLGSNTAVFALLLTLSFTAARTSRQLVIPATLLVAATAVCTYFYLFEQNWLFTILYGDYTGYAYVAYLAFVFAWFCDIGLNRARVSVRILNALGSATGSVGPC